MSLEIGARAPAFELPAAPGETVVLEDRLDRGPIVLLFFPLAFSRVCTAEMCAVRDRWEELRALDAVVFGISVDSPFALARFRESESIPFPLLSDFNRRVSRAYDVLYEDYFGLEGVSRRAVFVLDLRGVLRYAWVSEDSGVEPDYEAIREAVREARRRSPSA